MQLENIRIFPVGGTAACQYASNFLKRAGVQLVDHPTPEITHLLLDVPSFCEDGTLRGGGELKPVLRMLPPDITVVGGNLIHPALKDYHTLDLLQDAQYLAKNAAITAECALQVASEQMEITFSEARTLIIGWGRIGKCLGKLLRAMGADITIAVRKESDRAMLMALGINAVDIPSLKGLVPEYRLLFNTVPELILDQIDLQDTGHCLKIDLASKPGILGEDVIWAKGLPGVYVPESSGRLIAQTILRLSGEVSQ